MNRITPKRVAVFVGVMTAVAVLIYLPQQARKQRPCSYGWLIRSQAKMNCFQVG